MYIIKFLQPASTTFDHFERGDLLEVSREEMFRWVEFATDQDIKILILEAKILCDLS